MVSSWASSISITLGVYVNKTLANDHNIDIPDPDWTIEEYTDFVLQGNKETFWGAMDTRLVSYQLEQIIMLNHLLTGQAKVISLI